MLFSCSNLDIKNTMNSHNQNRKNESIQNNLVMQVLNELSRSINISTTYGENHSAAISAVETTASAMNQLFEKRAHLKIGTCDSILMIDEIATKTTGTLMIALERRLERLKIHCLSIKQGITKTEIQQLVHLLTLKKPSDFQYGINLTHLPHINYPNAQSSTHKTENITPTNNTTNKTNTTKNVPNTPQAPSSLAKINIKQTLAFLKGETGADTPETIQEFEEMALIPSQLASALTNSIAICYSTAGASEKSLRQITLDFLKKTYNTLRNRPVFQSSEGKEKLSKALQGFEKSFLMELHSKPLKNNVELDQEIILFIKTMKESLDFEAAAIQYHNHMLAMEKEKETMLSFCKNHGEKTANHLIANTKLPLAQWHQVIAEDVGHDTSGQNSDNSEQNVDDSLATVFEKLEHAIQDNELHEEEVKSLLEKANTNLDDTVDTTRDKLDQLSKQLQVAKAGTIGGQGRKMEQRELLAALAEVAQELMQPLTAINASLEMMLNGFVGEITNDQRDLLDLASDSGEHLKYLMKGLIGIVGCPTNKGVDSRYHTTSGQVVQRQEANGQRKLNL